MDVTDIDKKLMPSFQWQSLRIFLAPSLPPTSQAGYSTVKFKCSMLKYLLSYKCEQEILQTHAYIFMLYMFY